jgi:hypothetical protein
MDFEVENGSDSTIIRHVVCGHRTCYDCQPHTVSVQRARSVACYHGRCLYSAGFSGFGAILRAIKSLTCGTTDMWGSHVTDSMAPRMAPNMSLNLSPGAPHPTHLLTLTDILRFWLTGTKKIISNSNLKPKKTYQIRIWNQKNHIKFEFETKKVSSSGLGWLTGPLAPVTGVLKKKRRSKKFDVFSNLN